MSKVLEGEYDNFVYLEDISKVEEFTKSLGLDDYEIDESEMPCWFHISYEIDECDSAWVRYIPVDNLIKNTEERLEELKKYREMMVNL